jgi:UDP-N-acetylmuramate dehydrogenase
MELIPGADLRALNTFRVAARATCLAQIEHVDDLRRSVELADTRQWPILVLGGGSNILFRQDYTGLVLNIRLRGMSVVAENPEALYLRAAAGESWHQFVRWSVGLGYGGLENLSLIPGTVGAAPIQNIGAYGVELAERLHAIEALDLATGELRRLHPGECAFGYRTSAFKGGVLAKHVVTAIEVRLPRQPHWVLDYPGVRQTLGDERQPLDATRISNAICAIRQQKLPDPVRIGNAGSFFHNPLVSMTELEQLRSVEPELPAFELADGRHKLPAAWLVERCGWKGFRHGDAGVYREHALVLVNHGSASGAELWELAEAIRASVLTRFGLLLNPEPVVI